ncbi:MAG: diguanylate cyclase [Magnetovibrio sp.]|nr:diguanylate cyclase [Magnetovibrio sp.]
MPFSRFIKELNVSWDQAHHLLIATPHSPYLRRHRVSYIIGRVQLVSFLFAIFIPLWSVVDYFVFPWPQWAMLTGMRVVSALVFVLLAWPWKIEPTGRNAFGMMVVMLLGPPAFYLATLPMFNEVELSTMGQVVTQLYALLPFIVLAGLSVFPLTVVETVLFGVPFLVLTAYGASLSDSFSWDTYIGTLWLALLILAVSLFAGISQLRYMITLVSQSSLDPLTGTYTRRSGSEIIDMQYRVSIRQQAAFTIVFFDLDHFKSINDTYGHDEGDKTLIMFTENLQSLLRGSDVIVRWGGEEFLAVLPNTDLDGARLVIKRITDQWLGDRPDGHKLTASIGVSERKSDGLDDWPDLVELADKRMYESKKTGRARALMPGNEVIADENVKLPPSGR